MIQSSSHVPGLHSTATSAAYASRHKISYSNKQKHLISSWLWAGPSPHKELSTSTSWILELSMSGDSTSFKLCPLHLPVLLAQIHGPNPPSKICYNLLKSKVYESRSRSDRRIPIPQSARTKIGKGAELPRYKNPDTQIAPLRTGRLSPRSFDKRERNLCKTFLLAYLSGIY